MDHTTTEIADLSPAESEVREPLPEEEGGDFSAFPLSFAQERLWFLDQLEPGNPLYNVPLALRLEGRLDGGALDRALTEIARRHEVLRTTFHTLSGRPVQIIAPPREFSAERVDLSSLAPAEREAEARRLSEAEARKPFDLSAGPVWRALLVRLRETEHMLLLTMHHIVSDGWSMGLLAREASALYSAFSLGQPSPLPELEIQYADYAVWQREWLQGEELERQLAYWRTQLAGAPPVLELPTDRPRPARPTLRGATHRFSLPESLTRGVNALGRAAAATPFMVLLAAWQTLLARYTNQTDIAVGTPVANRRQQELEGLVGLFINTLVLRTDLSGDPTFRELLGRVRETALGAYAHQDVPFEKLVEDLQPARSLSHSPLFQVAFNLRNEPAAREPVSASGVSLKRLPVERGSAKFDLSLNVAEQESGFRCALEYSTELFDETTIRRLAGHFETLLAGAVARPDARVSDLPLLTEGERRRLLVEWNDTRRDYPREVGVVNLFEARAAERPEAAAVVHGPEALTYGELNRRANRLARRLRSLGVGPEVIVGVCAERSPELIVALLAVLKAGGAYLPLDPEYPRERIGFMLEDARVTVLLTQGRLVERLPAHAARLVRLDSDWETIARESAENPPALHAPDNLAYVIYTSGSTGRPKGVEVAHRGLLNLVAWHRDRYRVSAEDRATQLAGLSFDASVWEVWPYLASGASLYLADEETRRSPAQLVRWLAEESVTFCFMPTPLAEAALAEDWPRASALKVLLAGGDKLHRGPDAAHHFKLVNHYGPTESSVVTTCAVVEPGGAEVTPPIGRPIANTRVYILDAAGRPVPVGVAGELHVGGDSLARGYLGRPELTAERFVPDAFSAEPGARLYRTGDLARYLADGQIEFLGRIDQQVKVRGFRIELGEIEAVLGAHASVGECVVVTREGESGDKRIVAYVVSAAGRAVDEADLRAHLGVRLPEHMIPSAFVPLDALPLTPNGKVDRRALPAPDATRPGDSYVAPRNETEEILAGLWSEVLRVERAGVENNFFDLGGHSLLATRLMARVREAFKVELPLRALFESPTVAGLAACVERESRAGRHAQAPPLVRVERAGPLPLSFAQQRLWFLEQLTPGGAAYNVPAAVRLEGRLDVPALEESLREVVRRHESLRTTFKEVGGEPAQVFEDEPDFKLPLTDLTGLPEGEREQEARRLVAAEAGRPFDLAAGPLLRATLVRLGEQEHVLCLVTHHIVSDGWSLDVLVREVGALYSAFTQGRPSPLAELPIQYADYAVWQRELLRGEELERQLAYWRAQLAGAPPVLELPTDRPRPAVQRFRGQTHSFTLPHGLSAQLKELSRREGVTLFMTLLAAFQTLLSRYTGQEDVVVGTPVAGRTRLETESLIGFFVNTLALRADLSADPTFRQLLGRVREATLGAYAHQDVPFERLVEELQPERQLSRPPLFQVMLVLQNAPRGSVELPGLSLSPQPSEGGAAKFDLTLTAREAEAGLACSLNYDSDLFDGATAARLATHFEGLLRAAASDADRPVSTLPLLSEPEKRRLLVEWNDTARDYPRDRCIHELFEEQAARTPDAVAVVAGEARLTYAELNRRADELARRLRALGVGPEVRAGVCLERSPELLVSLLAVLKAGGAYVPLDPAYPQERIGFMVADAGMSVLLTQESLLGRLPEHGARVMCVDTERPGDAPRAGATPAAAADGETRAGDSVGRAATPDNLAYVIYTSGSTGRPKGVAIEHRSAATLIHWAHETYSREELSAVLASTSVCFDLSVFELFAPLSCGGRVILAENALQLPSLSGHGVTLVNTVPSAMAELARARALPPSVRTVNLAGEPLKRALVERVYESESVERVLNLYGPSEDTTYSTFELVGRGERREPTVGRPVSNTQIYLLDKSFRPVPVGVAAELYIGGEGLARGYLNRPELTAERFVPDPFGAQPGGRLYRTGDLARYLHDGRIEFLGRADHQVKVRGFRIELGEIESALGTQAGVRECVVVAREDESGDKRIVAYVATGAEQPPGVTQLRDSLKERLPEYMIPSAFVFLDALPLTPNGKVDRKALPAPEQTRTEGGAEYVAPRNEVEELLAGLWSEVLRVRQVGVEDNFFDLGGHSLLATRLVARVRETFRVELPLRALFESPTVAGLAAEVEQRLRAGRSLQSPPLVRVERTGPLPLSFAQQRLWFLEQLTPGGAAYNVPAALRLKGHLDAPALEESLREVVRRHESLRTTFKEMGGEPVQVFRAEPDFGWAFTDLSVLPEGEREQEARRLVAAEAGRPFDLAAGPLLRATLVRLAADEHVLCLVTHHIVSDGWSLDVLVREVGALYSAFTQGRPSPLAELPVQYADYAVWQREWLQGPALEEQLAYWRGRLAGAPPALDLPTDRPRPAVQRFRGQTHQFSLPDGLSAQLKELSRREGATLFMTLLAAFQTLLSRHTGQEDVVVGSPIAGRQRLETEGLIGFFVNTLALRTDLSGDPSFRELLKRVREATLGAYAHQDVPFERLVEELQPERQLSRPPLFQVMLVLQNAPRGSVELPGLSLSPQPSEGGAAKFDLTLTAREAEAGLACSLNYDSDLFDGATAARLAARLVNLLQGVAADADRPLSTLPLLTEGERQQLLVEWNDTTRDYRRDACIHELFESQVGRTPEAVALVHAGGRLTYRELNRRADELARHLRGLGVGPETMVGVLLARSPELLVSLLAVLKAGGAYVPLDPAYPQERIGFMLGDAAVHVLLTQERLVERLPEHGARVLCVDAGRPGVAWPGVVSEADLLVATDAPEAAGVAGSAGRAASAVTPGNLAYIIYTSGSTGRPKGVAIEHRSAAAMLGWAHETFSRGELSAVLASTSVCFDLSVFELFAPLTCGGSVVLAENALQLPALAEYGVTLVNTVPSAMAELVRAGGVPDSVKTVNLAGEPLKRALVEQVYETTQAGRVWNLYGPSEDTTYSTFELVARGAAGEPSVGRPVSNTQIYLLDRQLRLVPAGTAGELYIGGEGLARGYLNRPELTAERFVPDPFGAQPGGRLYRTGDLARHLPDGRIEFLGRIDHQVKVRGFRIELGEIEAAIGAQAAVRECVVVAREDESGDKRIVAYVVAASESAATDVGELRTRLKERLPEYMIPSAFAFLDALPLTPNGKVDRKALPEPGRGLAEQARRFVEPRNEVEAELASMWAEVLRVERVGVEDNFFDLGGHSLLATRLVARVREAFGVELPLRKLFEEPTVARVAVAVIQEQSEQLDAQELERLLAELEQSPD